MTLLARDEADIVDAQIAFHLSAGVDFVIATDNRSHDGTTEILESYSREGYLHLIREPGEDMRQGEWVTGMARMAATDFGADWVINSDADEFWWPRGTSLKDVLAHVPARYGIIQAIWRNFLPRPDDGAFFAERMTVRLAQLAPINDPASPFRPTTKVVHRADRHAVVSNGNHALIESTLVPLRGWYPVEVLHFGTRSLEQFTLKIRKMRSAFGESIGGHYAKAYDADRAGRLAEYYESMLVDDDALARGLEEGTLAVDTRVRDVLRLLPRRPRVELAASAGGEGFALFERAAAIELPRPSVVDDAAHAVEAAVLGEADVVRLQRRVDELEQRMISLELQLPLRLYRRLSEAAKRLLRR